MDHNLWLLTPPFRNILCPPRDMFDPGSRTAMHHPGDLLAVTVTPICARDYRVPCHDRSPTLPLTLPSSSASQELQVLNFLFTHFSGTFDFSLNSHISQAAAQNSTKCHRL
eukprot:g27341.t1